MFGEEFKFDSNLTYRFCKTCVQPFGTSLTCGATLHTISNFCEEHREFNAPRPCPKCKVMTLLLDGCNHITCTCGEHWCWLDGKGGFYDDNNIGNNELPGIYQHMREMYGGYYGNLELR